MNELTTETIDALLEFLFRGGEFPPPGTVYVALYLNEGATQEVQGGGYVRRQATFTAPVASPDGRRVDNATFIEWPTAAANWGTVVSAGVTDATTGGRQLGVAQLPTPRTINFRDIMRVNQGDLRVFLK